MLRERLREQRLWALTFFGILLTQPPLLGLFNYQKTIGQLPLLYFYLFACWAALILGTYMLMRRPHRKSRP